MIHLGVDLGGTKTEILALSESGECLLRHRRATPAGDYIAVLQCLVELVAFACQKADDTCYTLGVGIPGSLSPGTGLVRNANSTCLNGRALQADLEGLLKHSASFANDANCFALSEATDGSAAGSSSVFGVIIGTGTGAGMVIDGQVHQGANGIAGEWGHNPLPWMRADEFPGERCWCGRRGCIETWLSGPGLLAAFERSGGKAADAREVVAMAREGRELARSCLDDYILRLGKSLAHVINLFDPEVIVLGGGMSNIQELYAQVPDVWSRFVFADQIQTRLVAPKYGDSSGVRGAAWLGMRAQ